MNQMYRVRYVRQLPDDIVELGDCIVCAPNSDAARDGVERILELSSSKTEFEITRVKPSLYLIGRREERKSITSSLAMAVDAELASRATFPGQTENRPDVYWYQVSASANVHAEDENAAIVKLAQGINREMQGEKQKNSVRELNITCDRREFHSRTANIEQNALYTHLRFFKGGDTRS